MSARAWLPDRADLDAATAATAAASADPAASLADVEFAAELEETIFTAYLQRPEAEAELEAGFVMATSAQRIAELEQRFADLTAQVDKLKHDAFMLRTLEEMMLRRAGYISTPQSARTGRPRHLQAVQGGQQ